MYEPHDLDLFRPVLRRVQRNGGPGLPKTLNVRAHLQFVWSLFRLKFQWQPSPAGGAWQQRVYPDYETYLTHQAGKLPRLDLRNYDRTYREILRGRIGSLPLEYRGARVLCLGARIGTEVKAFIDLGAFAVGVDINPGARNGYVVHGDFHHLQYADGTIDVAFSNSVDHVLDFDRWIAEVRRVLRPQGVLLLELSKGLREGGTPEFYESLCWSSVDEMASELERRGFRTLQQRSFTEPNDGVQLLLQREELPAGA